MLSAAALLGVRDEDEAAMAYAFSVRVAARYAVGQHGDRRRVTDGYRGKDRILGETFSLSHLLIYAPALWSRARFGGTAPTDAFEAGLKALPGTAVTWLTRDGDDRAVPFANRMREGTRSSCPVSISPTEPTSTPPPTSAP